jgi:hypothetical protein
LGRGQADDDRTDDEAGDPRRRAHWSLLNDRRLQDGPLAHWNKRCSPHIVPAVMEKVPRDHELRKRGTKSN